MMNCELFYLCYAERSIRGSNLGAKIPSREETITKEGDLPASLVGQKALPKQRRYFPKLL